MRRSSRGGSSPRDVFENAKTAEKARDLRGFYELVLHGWYSNRTCGYRIKLVFLDPDPPEPPERPEDGPESDDVA